MKKIILINLFLLINLLGKSQISFALGNYYRGDMEWVESYYKYIKIGFDQEFYTPLVQKLKGNIESCVIEEILPNEELKKIELSNQEQKTKSKRKHKTIKLLTYSYFGYDTYNFTYELDTKKRIVNLSLLEVKLFGMDTSKIKNVLSIYSVEWNNSRPVAVYFQSRSWKERNSEQVIIMKLDSSVINGHSEHKVFSSHIKIDTTLPFKLKTIYPIKKTNTEAINDPKITCTHHPDGSSTESVFFVNENDTLFKYIKKYNQQGLLLKQTYYNRKFSSNQPNIDSLSEVINYAYNAEGLPTKISYQQGKNTMQVYMLKFNTPDEYENNRKMEIYDQNNKLILNIGWRLKYQK